MSNIKRKTNIEMWFSIANIICTLLIGVGVAIYLNFQNERFQKELINLQVNAQSEANFAHLELSMSILSSDVSGLINVSNTSIATAKNVRIAIVEDSIGDAWKSLASDIGKFTFSTYPPVYNISERRLKINYGNALHDAIMFNLATLPPKDELSINFKLANSVLITRLQPTIRTNLYINSPKSIKLSTQEDYLDANNKIGQLLNQYINYKFQHFKFIAQFDIDSTCDNCEADNANNQYDYQLALPSSALNEFNGNFLKSHNGYVWEGDMTISYIMPSTERSIPITSILYLQTPNLDGLEIKDCQPTAPPNNQNHCWQSR